jgi:hypothetical protein
MSRVFKTRGAACFQSKIENRKSKIRLAVLFLALLASGTPIAWAHSDKKKGASASPGPSGVPQFNVPIPIKHDAQGVYLPMSDVHGKLQMEFSIENALRLDLGHLDMTNAFMQTYDDKGMPDANVFLTRSVLDLNTRIVTSDIPVTVHRSDFEITGQKMVFNTQTRAGHMTGHVRMVIYNLQEAAPSPSPTAASNPSPQPSATHQ